jgi:hypothetical protein
VTTRQQQARQQQRQQENIDNSTTGTPSTTSSPSTTGTSAYDGLALGIVTGFQTRGGLRVRVGGVRVRVYRSQPQENPYPWHGFVRV